MKRLAKLETTVAVTATALTVRALALALAGTWACSSHSAGEPAASDKADASAAIASEARPLGGSWASCGFPERAEASVGVVSLRVLVNLNGKPASVEIVAASEPVFAEHARRCALSMTYAAAKTANGEPILTYTPIFVVRFAR